MFLTLSFLILFYHHDRIRDVQISRTFLISISIILQSTFLYSFSSMTISPRCLDHPITRVQPSIYLRAGLFLHGVQRIGGQHGAWRIELILKLI